MLLYVYSIFLFIVYVWLNETMNADPNIYQVSFRNWKAALHYTWNNRINEYNRIEKYLSLNSCIVHNSDLLIENNNQQGKINLIYFYILFFSWEIAKTKTNLACGWIFPFNSCHFNKDMALLSLSLSLFLHLARLNLIIWKYHVLIIFIRK